MGTNAQRGGAVTQLFDLLIVGGGINGVGIARDAAGRGLRVLLVEQGDLAGGTSSASTKLIHGGLRYLEHGEFRLVREALQERSRLQAIAPHIVAPQRFVLPTPPGGRPRWMVRLGLWLYDHLSRSGNLPRSGSVRLDGPLGEGLRTRGRGFSFYDCRVDDARLVVLNALSAREHGADIRVRTRLVDAIAGDGAWCATLEDADGDARETVRARVLINAAGPWLGQVEQCVAGDRGDRPLRLVKGSHIIVRRLFPGEQAYFLQNDDGRVMFVIPYEGAFTLVGTTEEAFSGSPSEAAITPEEVAYLCRMANRYLADPIAPENVIHSYAGVRSLHDDGSDDASAVSRDYVLRLDERNGPPELAIFGGKITTYRRLAEHVLAKVRHLFTDLPGPWTAREALPGGDFGAEGVDGAARDFRARYPFLPAELADRLARTYGTRAERILGSARKLDDLGEQFGMGLTAAEVDYLMREEWARSPEDVLWRRTKLGLHYGASQEHVLSNYMAGRAGENASFAQERRSGG